MAPDYRGLSLWHATAPDALEPRAPLPGPRTADVAIVGAGYTGLWTAYYLQELDPSLRIVLLESEIAGFGASGRNGGWCSALFPVGLSALARDHGRPAAVAQHLAMRDSLHEVGRVITSEGIDAQWALGGTITVARNPMQLQRAHEEIREAAQFDRDPADLQLLDAGAATSRLQAQSVLGGAYSPHCAAPCTP
jgi:glycine/D-amino acid oxidase-like deaminating enzyme